MSGQYGLWLKELLDEMRIADSEKLCAEGETVVIDTKTERIILSRKNGVLSITSSPTSAHGSVSLSTRKV